VAGAAPLPTFLADAFDRMVADTRPDTVIVTTVDATHHRYIVRAMELGCDVITEKPMTTDAEKMRAIFDAIARTGKSLRVTFNYCYAPAYTVFRRLMMDGVVGRPRASTSPGFSTPGTARTTSGAGTASGRAPAGSWCTRRPTTSTS
jgi:predicted dehydrogenase